jgi:CAAX protease family protein
MSTAIRRKEQKSMFAANPAGTTIAGQERYLIAYFVLVLASAGLAALLLLAFPGVLPTLPILLLASWMPNLVGIAVTAKAGGRPALRELFSRAVRWRFGIGWYAVALLIPIAAVLVALSIGGLTRIDAPRAITDANVLIPLLVFNVLAGPLGEELGWRGTALPRLLARWGALTSSLILGIVWWTFHTPGFVLGLFSPGFTPLSALLGAFALTVLITWMFNNTGGSLIPGSLMHLSINFVTAASGVSESPLLYGLTVGGLLIAAVGVVMVYGHTHLVRMPGSLRGLGSIMPGPRETEGLP